MLINGSMLRSLTVMEDKDAAKHGRCFVVNANFCDWLKASAVVGVPKEEASAYGFDLIRRE